jgi:hypothetical protein
MANTTDTATQQPLPTGTRVAVYGTLGVVLHVAPDGMIAVRLDGESTTHYWSPSQVEVVA